MKNIFILKDKFGMMLGMYADPVKACSGRSSKGADVKRNICIMNIRTVAHTAAYTSVTVLRGF